MNKLRYTAIFTADNGFVVEGTYEDGAQPRQKKLVARDTEELHKVLQQLFPLPYPDGH